jgi:hypothetical protein
MLMRFDASLRVFGVDLLGLISVGRQRKTSAARYGVALGATAVPQKIPWIGQ